MQIIDSTATDFDQIRSQFEWRIPERFNMARAVCEQHSKFATDPALYFEDQDGNSRVYTFGEVRTLSNQLANALAALGIGRGDRVGIVLPQGIETGISHIAIHKLGAISVPLSVLFGPEAIEFRLRDSGARAVIASGHHVDMTVELKTELPELRTVISCEHRGGDARLWNLLEHGSEKFDMFESHANDPALLIYTSGTTGPPKGALVPHRALLGNLPGFEMSQNFYPKAKDVFWTPADWAWTGGLLDGLFPTWVYRRPIVAFSGGKFDPERACAVMRRYRVTNAFIPPTALKMMRQVPRIESYGLGLRAVMSAGESMGAELYDWGADTLNVKINEMWGQTEFNYLVGNCTAVMPVKPGSMGKCYPGHTVDAIDPDGSPMPVGEQGELAARVGDPVMFLEYWNNPEATREKIVNGWFRTGDIGVRDEDGYLWYIGRMDDVISSAGYRVGPGEIEDSLIRHPAVAQAAVIGIPDELRGSVIKAYIVLAENQTPSNDLKREIQDQGKK